MGSGNPPDKYAVSDVSHLSATELEAAINAKADEGYRFDGSIVNLQGTFAVMGNYTKKDS